MPLMGFKLPGGKPVDPTNPNTNDVLAFDGSRWTSRAPTALGVVTLAALAAAGLFTAANIWTSQNTFTAMLNLQTGTINFTNHVLSFPPNSGTLCVTNMTGYCGATPAPTILINSINASKFTIRNTTINGITGQNFNIRNITINGLTSKDYTVRNVTINSVVGQLFTIYNDTINGITGHSFTIRNTTLNSFTAQTFGFGVVNTGNLTVTNSSATNIKYNLGSNAVITGGSPQKFSKSLDLGVGQTDKFDNAGIIIRNPTATSGNTIKGGAITSNITENLGVPNSNVQISYQPIFNMTTPKNNTSTNVPSVMLGAFATLTPRYSGNATVTVNGYGYANKTSGSCQWQIQTSSSYMGLNGAAIAGSKVGNAIRSTSSVAQGNFTVSEQVTVTGMTPGTKQFFDLAFGRATTSTYCKLLNVWWNIREQ